MSITDFYNGRFVSGKILKRDYRIIWQRIVIATAALCGMFIFYDGYSVNVLVI